MYATYGHDVLCSMAQIDLTGLVPCSHDEADTRLFLHVADVVKKGTGNCWYVQLTLTSSWWQ